MRKLLSLLIIGFLLIFNFNLLKSSYESQQKLKEVGKEEEKIKDLEKTNESLRDELERRNSNYFIEQEARNRLGFGKPGEEVIVIDDGTISGESDKEENPKSNFEKWLEVLKI